MILFSENDFSAFEPFHSLLQNFLMRKIIENILCPAYLQETMELCQSFPRLDPFGGISISFVVESASQPNIIFPAETKIICLTLELPRSQVTCDLKEIEESKRQLFSSEISNERKKGKRECDNKNCLIKQNLQTSLCRRSPRAPGRSWSRCSRGACRSPPVTSTPPCTPRGRTLCAGSEIIIFVRNSHNKNSLSTVLQICKEDETFGQRTLDHFFY